MKYREITDVIIDAPFSFVDSLELSIYVRNE
jgi:hypothetical protein